MYLRFSFFSLCLSMSLPLSLASFCLSSLFSLFLCLPLCFLPPTGRSKGTGGGGLGVRGPFFLLCPLLEGLTKDQCQMSSFQIINPPISSMNTSPGLVHGFLPSVIHFTLQLTNKMNMNQCWFKAKTGLKHCIIVSVFG